MGCGASAKGRVAPPLAPATKVTVPKRPSKRTSLESASVPVLESQLVRGTGALLIMNLGAEMMFIIDQRMRAQRVVESNKDRVMGDLLGALFPAEGIDQFFDLKQGHSVESCREFFDRAAHVSIMKLNKQSMDKLFNLMIMVFKYQTISCSSCMDLIDITENHIGIMKQMVEGNEEVSSSLDQYSRQLHSIYGAMDLAHLGAIRRCLCTFFQDKNIKITLLLEHELQNKINGSMVVPSKGDLPKAKLRTGTVRYFAAESGGGEEDRTEQLPVALADTWLVGNPGRTTLGENIYSKVWSVKARDDHGRGSMSVSREVVPSYWTSKNHEESMFEQMVYVSREHHDTFSEVLKQSYLPIATQDRVCPWVWGPAQVKCNPQPGGCPCIRPGGNPGLPTGFNVRRIIRVENSGMWARYIGARDAIRKRRAGDDFWKFQPPILTCEATGKSPEVFGQLDTDHNEAYLWHGTPVRTALSIAHEDFNIDLAGNNAGSMYGQGLYLAESCTKADEYARDERGHYDGVFALLLCRVCMGKFYRTTQRDEKAISQVLSGSFDSVCGDRAKSVGTYREFVIYDSDQLYPEFVILYSRNFANSRKEPATTPFHMELPIYWGNCHVNPRLGKDAFNEQFALCKSTLNLLQQFAQASAKAKITVISARRIENSTIWSSYVDFKVSLQAKKKDIDILNDVATRAYLKQQEPEEALSWENQDQSVNEFLLWHGTTNLSAETIAADDFKVAVDSCAHGSRFGNGVYFAESLDKSLSYAKDSATRHVLLCRVCCGDVYHTESCTEHSAHEKAAAEGKNCVLANPSGQGPREFVVLDAMQVYPEYILEIVEASSA